jgi:predicted acyl esterase
VSQRKLDTARSRPGKPFHPHDEKLPVVPGEIYEVDVEIWPTSLVLPPGYRLALTVQGHDYEFEGATPERLSNIKNSMRGSGPFVHDDPVDRPVYAAARPANVTLHTGGGTASRLLVPFLRR